MEWRNSATYTSLRRGTDNRAVRTYASASTAGDRNASMAKDQLDRQLRCRRLRPSSVAPRLKHAGKVERRFGSPVLSGLTEKEGNKPDISAEERGSPSSPPSPPPPFIPFIQPRRRKLMIGRKPTAGHIRENRALESCLLTQLAEPNVTLELGYISSWD